MVVSVRLHPLLEKELVQAARRQGVSNSQFIVAAIRRALGRKNPYRLMKTLQRKEQSHSGPAMKVAVRELPYNMASSKAALRARLKAKHDDRGVG